MERIRRNTRNAATCTAVLLVLGLSTTAFATSQQWLRSLRKAVTQRAGFIVYVPPGWSANETINGQHRILTVSDGSGQYTATVRCGRDPSGNNNAYQAAAMMLRDVRRQNSGFALGEARTEARTGKMYVSGTYVDRNGGRKEFLSWTTTEKGKCVFWQIAGPQGRLQAMRQKLVTILTNVKVGKKAFGATPEGPKLRLVRRQFRDGSGSIAIPADWVLQDFGKGAFVARSRADTMGFSSYMFEALTPQVGVRPRGIPVSWCLRPKQAVGFFARHLGTARVTGFTTVRQRPDLERLARQFYTVGPVVVEELGYGFVGKAGPSTGYSLGVSFGHRVNCNWKFWNVMVWGRNDLFAKYPADMLAMVGSYRIHGEFVQKYVRDGMQKVREMRRQTMEIVRRNAEYIRQVNYAAHTNRMRSSDYTDYLFTRYMRGEQDWISSREGGRVVRSDNWGVHVPPDGRTILPVNYVNFNGRTAYEQMTPIRTRAQFERHILNG